MKKLIKAAAAAIAACGLLLGSTMSAYAETDQVDGHMNKDGSLVQYDRERVHEHNGPIILNITHLPSGYLRMGLRNMRAPGGPQFTDSYQWDHTGAKAWNNILANTHFALQGRMKGCGGWWNLTCDDYWSGEVTF